MKISTTILSLITTLLFFLAPAAVLKAGHLNATSAKNPNIIFIVVDDWRFDEFGAAGHPYLETPNIDRLAAGGVMFTRAYHAVPLCSPNRASILTGQYPSGHGVFDNVARSRKSHLLKTFPQALKQSGYKTAFIGKWHMGNDPTPRPGFDSWTAIPGQGRTINPELYEQGKKHVVKGYITDILTDRAVTVIEEKHDRPFFIYIGHKAMHPDISQLDDGSTDLTHPHRYVPAPRHKGRYEQKVFPRRPNTKVTAKETNGKKVLRRALARKRSPEMMKKFGEVLDHGTSEETIRRRSEMLLAVDEGLGRIVESLKKTKQLNNTLIVFTSDNGYFYGEHGLSLERRLPYEESIRSPLIMHYPSYIKPGTKCNNLVLSIDLAPTALAVAHAKIGKHIQGQSLLPLLSGEKKNWRKNAYVEYYSFENPWNWLIEMDYRVVVSQRFKYIHWMHHPKDSELYDLKNDPYELKNIINNKEHKTIVDEMHKFLKHSQLKALGLN